MKDPISSSRSKYIFAIDVLAIGIGIASKKVIHYPTECPPTNLKITYEF